MTNPALDVSRAPAEPSARAFVRVATTRFGTLEVEEDLIITLPDGMIGLDHCKRFFVLRHDDTSAFRWLQSLDEPAIAFPIIDPRTFRPDYAVILADADIRALQLTETTPNLLFVIVTIPPLNPTGMTANLLAPIVVNGAARQGKQVVLQDQGYTTKHEIVKELKKLPLNRVLPAA